MAGISLANHYATTVNPLANGINQASNTLNNVAWLMLSKMKSPEELEALREQADLRRQQAQHYALQNAALEREAEEARGLPDLFVANAAGVTAPQLKAFRNYQQSGAWVPQEVPSKEFGSEYGQTLPGSAEAAGLSPAALNKIQSATAAFAARGKGSADATAKGMQNFMENDLRAGTLAGAPAPANIAAIGQVQRALDGTSPMFSTNGAGAVTNLLTGAVDASNPLAQANISKERAAAAEHNRGRPLMDAVGPDGKPILDANGRPVRIEASAMIPQLFSNSRTAATNDTKERIADTKAAGGAGKDLRLNKYEGTALDAALVNATPPAMTIPKEHQTALRAWATEFFVDRASPAYGNADAAAKLAYQQVYGNGGTPKGDWQHWIPFRNSRPEGAPNLELPNGAASPSATAVQQPKQQQQQLSQQQALPAAAAARLREGVQTKFGNGQIWTLQGGQPVRIQ